MRALTFTRRSANRLAIVLLVALAGCGRVTTDSGIRTLLAKNEEWTIMAIGNLESPWWPFTLNVVKFEASRRSELYAQGYLYEAAFDDRGFKQEYTAVEWQQTNAVRFWFDGAPPARPRIPILIKNDTTSAIKWLRVTGTDLLLVLSIPPGASTEVATNPSADMTYISVEGQLSNDLFVRRGTTAFSKTVRRLDLNVTPTGIAITGKE